jgi:hypothetical protein
MLTHLRATTALATALWFSVWAAWSPVDAAVVHETASTVSILEQAAPGDDTPLAATVGSSQGLSDTAAIVVPVSDVPGSWEVISEHLGQSPDYGKPQQVNGYHELATDRPGRLVGIVATQFDDSDSAEAALNDSVTRAKEVGRIPRPVDKMGDGAAVIIYDQVRNQDAMQRYGIGPDALAVTWIFRVDRYVLSVQTSGPTWMQPDLEALGTSLASLQESRARVAIQAGTLATAP